jgi:hypothetical protein
MDRATAGARATVTKDRPRLPVPDSSFVREETVALRGPIVLLVLWLTLIVAGCELFSTSAGPMPGDFDERGALIVGTGEIAGRQWQVTYTRHAGTLCSSVSVAGDAGEIGGCSATVGGNDFSSHGISSGAGRPTILEATIVPNAAVVEIVTSLGSVEVVTVSLSPLGVGARAFAQAFPAGTILSEFVMYDADGLELGRQNVGPHFP